MDITINKERLAQTFTTLCEISSPSRKERNVADHLKNIFTALGAEFIYEDNSAASTGSDSGNLVIRFVGSSDADPVFFACHMDTVKPGDDVQVRRNGDTFTSSSDTILGGDDKSGIAPVIELITLLKEGRLNHRTIELVFTTCEEIGLLGAKAFDCKIMEAGFGYALDSTGIDKVVTGAPAANKIRIDVKGIAAHAGVNPEAGVSAFLIAAKAITELRFGRIDDETTANMGIMEGGVATNVIPEHLVIKGEVRSHSPAKLDAYTVEIKSIFTKTATNWPVPDAADNMRPAVSFVVDSDYPAMRLSEDDIVLRTIKKASKKSNRDLSFIIGGGGSDANIFNGNGLSTAIIATGMNKVHTTDECLDLNDMVSLTELLYAAVTE